MKLVILKILLPVLTVLALTGFSSTEKLNSTSQEQPKQKSSQLDGEMSGLTSVSLLNTRIQNSAGSYIPAQCYTRTKGKDDKIHNPCFSCHANPKAPSYIDDASFQVAYEFRDTTRKNPWTNLFKDRTEAISNISDDAVIKYIRQSNYIDADGKLTLAEKLSDVPKEWDFNGDGKWNGYKPDCYFNFDTEGFDLDPQGQDTGWLAFGYTPFLGTFWPTNGSTDDVIIRLSEPFRQNEKGEFDRKVYKLNLAIIEALIKRENIKIVETDEALYGVDLDRNGQINKATQVTYKWAPLDGIFMSYVGMAKTLQEQKKVQLAGGLYPVGTEFLHSVRYVDFDKKGVTKMSPRFKELRYGIKTNWNNYSQLKNAAMTEVKEAHDFPDRVRTVVGNPEAGMLSGVGWAYQGFIEDKNGELRPQSYEESLNCIGCHAGISQTTDSSFAFPRKLGLDSFQQGWYHWTQKGLQGVAEPQWKDGTHEYTKYLTENHSGNEFRTNDEVLKKFFNQDGSLKQDAIQKMRSDISYLLYPSKERALKLNKAYKVIVDEQSYIYGREVHIKNLEDVVWDDVPEDELTGVKEAILIP